MFLLDFHLLSRQVGLLLLKLGWLGFFSIEFYCKFCVRIFATFIQTCDMLHKSNFEFCVIFFFFVVISTGKYKSFFFFILHFLWSRLNNILYSILVNKKKHIIINFYIQRRGARRSSIEIVQKNK